jgi:hypothetical protein
MDDTMRRNPHPEPDMAENLTSEETLTRLAQSRVATHLLRFSEGVVAAATHEDEVTALEHISDLVDGPIYRVAALTYALALPEGCADLPERLAARLGGCEPPELTALPAPEDEVAGIGPRHDALTIMGSLAQSDESLPGGRRVVIDARYAAAAAEATAARIEAVVAEFEARLSAQRDDAGHAERLERIESRLAALDAQGEKIDRIAAALEDRPADREPDADAGRLERIEAALEALSARSAHVEQALAAVAGADARIDALAEEIRARSDASSIEALSQRLDAVFEGVSNLSAAPTADGADMGALVDEVRAAGAALHSAADLGARFDALSDAVASLRTERAGELETATGLVAALRDLAERPSDAPGEPGDSAEIAAIAASLQEALARMEAQTDRLNDAATGNAERIDAVADLARRAAEAAESARIEALRDDLTALSHEVRAFADRAQGGHDLRRERESLSRILFSLQTSVSRLDGEVSRLLEAGIGGADDATLERLDALAEAIAPLTEGVAQAHSATMLGADHAAAVVGLVQGLRDEVAAMHAMQARHMETVARDADAEAGAGDALMDRVSATLAEFLARMERFEQGRAAAAPRPASLLAGRSGRSL